MNRVISAFGGGVLFAIGLGVSGMADANKVIGFLDLAGSWDPSLAFVMLGAIAVHLAFYRLLIRRESPLFGDRFHLPTRRDITPPLMMGSALFGVGWGLGGFCPGPALTSLAELESPAAIFSAFMLLGMLLPQRLQRPTPAASSQEIVRC
jgi:hypothetical protein